MRDLLILTLVYASLLPAASHPLLGILVFSWMTYMRPQDLSWRLTDARFLLLAGLALVVSLALHARRERWLTLKAETVLMALFAGWLWITTTLAVSPQAAEYWSLSLAKMIFVCVVTTGICVTVERVRALWLVIAFSLGLLGAKWGLYGIVHGGTRFDTGPGGSFSNNNQFATGLCMVLPMLVTVYRTEKRPLVRAAAAVTAVLCGLTILFTFSRGGFLALTVVLIMLFGGLLRSRRGAATLALGAAGVVLVVPLVFGDLGSAYLQRIGSIRSYEEDASATSRLESWQTALRIWRANPIFGVGPENFLVVRNQYGEPTGLVAHNTYLQILSENGAPGLALFLALFVASLLRLRRLRRQATHPRIRAYAGATTIAIAAYLVGVMFGDHAYNELIYHLFAIGVSLEAASAAAPPTASAGEPAAAAPLPAAGAWWR